MDFRRRSARPHVLNVDIVFLAFFPLISRPLFLLVPSSRIALSDNDYQHCYHAALGVQTLVYIILVLPLGAYAFLIYFLSPAPLRFPL